MVQQSIFGSGGEPEPKQPHDRPQRLRLLVTVKAAPNPSATYGETVCIAGLRLDPEHEGWVRLYPVNFRYLEDGRKFDKYDVIEVEARPNRSDPRYESWRPNMESLVRRDHLPPWTRRRSLIEPHRDLSMCALLREVRTRPPAKSLGLVRPDVVLGLDVMPHPGWTPEEQRKIDSYADQLDMFGGDRRALQAPRFKGRYRYRCAAAGCGGHAQGLLDWEFVALQRRLSDQTDDQAARAIRQVFLERMCGPARDVMFYVGNQAKHQQTFSVLGAYWPPRR